MNIRTCLYIPKESILFSKKGNQRQFQSLKMNRIRLNYHELLKLIGTVSANQGDIEFHIFDMSENSYKSGYTDCSNRAIEDFVELGNQGENPQPEIITNLFLFSKARGGKGISSDAITAIVVHKPYDIFRVKFEYGENGKLEIYPPLADVTVKGNLATIDIIAARTGYHDRFTEANGQFSESGTHFEQSILQGQKKIGCLERFHDRFVVSRTLFFLGAEVIDILKVCEAIPKDSRSLPAYNVGDIPKRLIETLSVRDHKSQVELKWLNIE